MSESKKWCDMNLQERREYLWQELKIVPFGYNRSAFDSIIGEIPLFLFSDAATAHASMLLGWRIYRKVTWKI